MLKINTLHNIDIESLMSSYLKKNEYVPEKVRKVVKYLYENDVGFILSRNKKAESCKDARSKRNRLGHVGITLFEELKSFVGKIILKSGKEYIIAIHCRAHVDISYEKVSKALDTDGKLVRLEDEELNKIFGLEYATVNPILLSCEKIQQIFDTGIFESIVKIPGTMMTNAGDKTWAIEFDPKVLIKVIPNVLIADISGDKKSLLRHENLNIVNPKSIGIITGNGPDSGIALHQILNDYIINFKGKHHFSGDISLPKVHMLSLPEMGLSMELKYRETATWNALSVACKQLCKKDIKILAVACNTCQYFGPEIKKICDVFDVEFISMSETVMKYVIKNIKNEENGIKDFAIIGIDTVAGLGEFSAFRDLAKFNPISVDQKIIKEIHEIGYQVKQQNNTSGFQKLEQIFDKRINTKNFIVALTELSIIIRNNKKSTTKKGKVIVDTLDLYGKEIAKASLSFRPYGQKNEEEMEKKST
ncbi:aspartate racemase-like protein [Candidatus Magnetomorum sp. HK-1]|nr:aspartate racemase-like protein [Candidatus Magnetomorum sp. HK-1]